MPVQYEPSSLRRACTQVNSCMASSSRPSASRASTHSAVSAAVTHSPVGDGDGATEGVVDRRRPGEQRVLLDEARCVERPTDRALEPLVAKDEVDAGLDGRPQVLEPVEVTGRDVAVPGPGGQIGADVGVEAGVLDPGGQVVVEPAAVG